MNKKCKNVMSRSEIMQRVKSKNTKIEIILRKELWKRGLRYQKNVKDIFGKPDIVFKGKKLVTFTDSEFWHGKKFLEGKAIPKTNTEYWVKKFRKNIERDKKVNKQLQDDGWSVMRFWGVDIKNDVSLCADEIEKKLKDT